jgi:hypothetical protein
MTEEGDQDTTKESRDAIAWQCGRGSVVVKSNDEAGI